MPASPHASPTGATASATGRWLRTTRPAHPDPDLHVVCFPPAGAASGSFAALRRAAGPTTLCSLALLPGRESRVAEQEPWDLDRMADHLAEAVSARLRETRAPCVLLGHSMGGLLAYEVTARLVTAGERRLLRLVVAGSEAPSGAAGHRLDVTDPVGVLRELSGAPQEVFDHPELLRMAAATLEADLRMIRRYRFGGARIGIPLTVLLGDRDPIVGAAAAAGWAELADRGSSVRVLAGDHFFLDPHYPELLAEWRREARAAGSRS
ncbi:thioesterase II family protein [Streptomyces fradiae]|uniref:thioesterase II family protein n=1 Tax=Streptomyces fradiae TaxID=1906 RepID=UPI003511326D